MADVIRNRAYQLWGVQEETAEKPRPKRRAAKKKPAAARRKPAAKAKAPAAKTKKPAAKARASRPKR